MKWSEFVYLFLGVIIPTYQMLEWFFRNFGKLVKRGVVHNAIDDIVYCHYKMQKMHTGHSTKFPTDCEDGDCTIIKSS